MPRMDGVTAIARMATLGVDSRALVLTTYDTESDVLPAIEAGAIGYLLKDTPSDELLRAVRAASRGETVLSPSVASQVVGRVRQPAEEPLSPPELEVLRVGRTRDDHRQIAAALFIGEATVKTHLLHLYGKLDVNDRAAAAFERGLLVPGRTNR